MMNKDQLKQDPSIMFLLILKLIQIVKYLVALNALRSQALPFYRLKIREPTYTICERPSLVMSEVLLNMLLHSDHSISILMIILQEKYAGTFLSSGVYVAGTRMLFNGDHYHISCIISYFICGCSVSKHNCNLFRRTTYNHLQNILK